jgi:hypothetical protein
MTRNKINEDIAQNHISQCYSSLKAMEYHLDQIVGKHLQYVKEADSEVSTKPGWVSVKDRLPKCNKKPDSFGVQVLIWPHATFSGTADSPVAFFGCRVTDEPSFYLYGAVLDGVEYWMELPEGPK